MRAKLTYLVGSIAILTAPVLTSACNCMRSQQASARAETEEEEEEEEEGKETRVELAQLSAPARAAVERLVGGGTIEKIDKEMEKGVLVYDVEANVGGKHVEYTIADKDGAVLGTETSIELADLPPPVKDAVKMHFDAGAKLEAMKCVEYGKTEYEVVGMVKGKQREAMFDESGKKVD